MKDSTREIYRGSESGGADVGFQLEFQYFTGVRLKFSVFANSRQILVNDFKF